MLHIYRERPLLIYLDCDTATESLAVSTAWTDRLKLRLKEMKLTIVFLLATITCMAANNGAYKGLPAYSMEKFIHFLYDEVAMPCEKEDNAPTTLAQLGDCIKTKYRDLRRVECVFQDFVTKCKDNFTVGSFTDFNTCLRIKYIDHLNAGNKCPSSNQSKRVVDRLMELLSKE